MTMANVDTLSAKYAVFIAVENAVDVTQMFRCFVLLRLSRLGVLGGELLVIGFLSVLVDEAPHLRIRPAVGRFKRVLPDHRGELLRLLAAVNELAGDLRVRSADDLLASEVVAHPFTAVEARHDRTDAKCDQDDACSDAGVLKDFLMQHSSRV